MAWYSGSGALRPPLLAVAFLCGFGPFAACSTFGQPAAIVPHHPNGWSDRSYYLVMRDGVKVAVSYYFPGGTVPAAPAPTILIQTRYGRATEAKESKPWNAAGYVVAVVDTRGSTASFGPRDVDIGPDEIKDMDEIIAHVASRPWANGQVIAYGFSYMADTADMATSRRAPALIASIPRETDFDAYLGLFWPGGVANDFMMQGWGGYTYETDYGRDGRGKGLDCAMRTADCAAMFPVLQPVDDDPDYVQMRTAFAGRHRWKPDDYSTTEFRDDIAKNGYALYASSPSSRLQGIRTQAVPVQYWGSWVDAGTAEAALARFRSTPGISSDIWITANNHGHTVPADPLMPNATGPVPSVDEQQHITQEFARRARAGAKIGRQIHYYVMGAGVFKNTDTWPVSGIADNKFAFAPHHRLISGIASGHHVDRYNVDFTATTGKATRWSTQFGTAPAYRDRRDEDKKLFVYDGAPLAQDMEVVGEPVVTLHMASKSDDPAVFVYLEDIAPDGRVTYLTEGQFRAIMRKPADPATLPYDQGPAPHSFNRTDASAVTPGKAMELKFALLPLSALIRKGHRIRVAIAGADADTFHHYSDGKDDVFFIYAGGVDGSAINLPMKPWSS